MRPSPSTIQGAFAVPWGQMSFAELVTVSATCKFNGSFWHTATRLTFRWFLPQLEWTRRDLPVSSTVRLSPLAITVKLKPLCVNFRCSFTQRAYMLHGRQAINQVQENPIVGGCSDGSGDEQNNRGHSG
jgi:hypothetical protein